MVLLVVLYEMGNIVIGGARNVSKENCHCKSSKELFWFKIKGVVQCVGRSKFFVNLFSRNTNNPYSSYYSSSSNYSTDTYPSGDLVPT